MILYTKDDLCYNTSNVMTYKMNRTSSMKGDCPMTDALKKFFEIVSNDEELKAKLNALIADEDAAGVVALAASCGIELSEDELTFHAAPETHELSDDELDAVAGGRPMTRRSSKNKRTIWWDDDPDNCTNNNMRNIYTGGFPNCAATVEDGSHCGTNDACYTEAVDYEGMVDCAKAWK
jgi:predicted ribosomally synthesized peptide with nif11-like leader